MAIASSARARQVGDAAITVLAGQGARGLTHRAVDQAAGLPPGTTSNYARTRAALLTLALTRIGELETADGESQLGRPDALHGPDELRGPVLADGLAAVLHRWVTDPGARQRVLARFELALEATQRAELRATYNAMGHAIRVQVAAVLAAAGSAHPERDAWTLIAWMEGTAFYALA